MCVPHGMSILVSSEPSREEQHASCSVQCCCLSKRGTPRIVGLQSHPMRKSRAGRSMQPTKACMTAAFVLEHQTNARKKRKTDVARARRQRMRAEHRELKAKALAQRASEPSPPTNTGPAMFVGQGRGAVQDFARQLLCRELRRHRVCAGDVAPRELYAGSRGGDEVEQLAAMLVGKGWVDCSGRGSCVRSDLGYPTNSSSCGS